MKNQGTLKWIFKSSKGNIFSIVLLSVISGISSARFVVFALVSKTMIDIASGQTSGSILNESLIIFSLIIAQAILNIAFANVSVRATGKIEIALRKNIFTNLLKKKFLQASSYHTGELMNRLTSDVTIVVNGVSSIIPNVISIITKLISCLIVLFAINSTFSFILIFVALIMLSISRLFSKKMKQLHKKVQQTDGETRSFMQEILENLIVVKSYNGEKKLVDRLKDFQMKNFAQKIKRNFFSNLANTSIYLIFSSSYYVALTFGAFELSKGLITFGTLTAFLQIINQVQSPFLSMSGLIPQFYSTIASSERIIELEQLEDEKKTLEIDKNLYSKMERIVFENVTFSYKEDIIIENLNLTIKKGDFLGLSGKSGIGKSTILKLLLGLIEPNSGSIYIVDKDNKKTVLDASTRHIFAFVPQGNMILSGSIKENIAFFNDSASFEEIENAAKIADIYDFVITLPDGFDTILGERGIGFSEGQIQRLAIARGIVSGAEILLLDEVTSALDEETQIRVMANLKALENRTAILISHKTSTLSLCDSILEI
jgi:ATP-binding cassette subfamily B protein